MSRRTGPAWASLSNDELLDVRLKDLKIQVEDSWIAPSVDDLFPVKTMDFHYHRRNWVAL